MNLDHKLYTESASKHSVALTMGWKTWSGGDLSVLACCVPIFLVVVLWFLLLPTSSLFAFVRFSGLLGLCLLIHFVSDFILIDSIYHINHCGKSSGMDWFAGTGRLEQWVQS